MPLEFPVLLIIFAFVCAAAIIGAVFCGFVRLLSQTRLHIGDYSQRKCECSGCGKPAACRLRYNYSAMYYCADHISIAKRLAGESSQENVP